MDSNHTKSATLLINSLGGGGAENVCVNVANGLAKRGWDITLVVMHSNDEAYTDRVSSKVNIIELGVNNSRYAFFPLKRFIQQEKPKVFLVFTYELSVILVLLRYFTRHKYKIISRNINNLSSMRFLKKQTNLWSRVVTTPLIDLFYPKSDHVINQCKAMEEDILQVYPALQGKTSVIYNPVAQHIEDYAKKNDLDNIIKQDYFLCVGRLEKQKAFHFAIEAFAKVVNLYPYMRLKLVGQGVLNDSLKKLAMDLNVFDNIDFVGFKTDVIPYYTKAKATILTSLFEGFPNVLVESITLGTPVIAFDCPSGPREIIQNGVNGYLVKYLDVQSLSKYMIKTIKNNDFIISKVKDSLEFNKTENIITAFAEKLNNDY